MPLTVRFARLIGVLACVLCVGALIGVAPRVSYAQSAPTTQRVLIQGQVVTASPSQLVFHTSTGNQVIAIDAQTMVSPHAMNLASLGAGASLTVQAQTTPDGRLHALQIRLPVSGQTLSPTSATAAADLSIASVGQSEPLGAPTPGVPWAWGVNDWAGVLGSGNTDDAPTPIALTGLSNIAWIAPGSNHTLALTNDGTVLAWGDNWPVSSA